MTALETTSHEATTSTQNGLPSNDPFDRDQAQTFLQTLWASLRDDPAGYVEARPIGDYPQPEFFDLTEGVDAAVANLLDYVQEHVGDRHIYFGVNPRCPTMNEHGEEELAGGSENVQQLVGLWADLDGKDYAGGLEEAQERIDEFPLAPTITVQSGNGFHVYFLFGQAMDLHREEDRQQARQLNELLQNTLQADATPDLARLMRLPGTPNIKHPDYNDESSEHNQQLTSNPDLWKPCQLIDIDEARRYSPEDLEVHLPSHQLQEAVKRTQNNRPRQTQRGHEGDYDLPEDCEWLDDALDYIPASDYWTWLRVGMALREEFGEAGFEIWDEWSRGSNKYEGREETRKKWNTFDRGPARPVTLGTIWHLAEEHGWDPSSSDTSGLSLDEAQDIIDEAARHAAQDPGAPFEEDALQAAVYLKEASPAEFQRYRQRIKPHINLNDYRNALNQHQATSSSTMVVRKNETPANQPPARIIEEDGRYFRAPEQPQQVPDEDVSNFVFEPDARITLPGDKEVIQGQIDVLGGGVHEVELSNQDLVDSRSLLNAVPTSEAAWYGSVRDVQFLRMHLLGKEIPRLEGKKVVGRHEDRLVLPDRVLDTKGPVDDPDMTFVRGGRDNALLQNLPQSWPDSSTRREATKAVLQHLPRINEAAVAAGMVGWFFALPFCSLIRRRSEWGFPHLVLWGRHGCGKTSSGELLLRLAGFPESFDAFSLPGTRFVRLIRYSITNLFPVMHDEYRESSWGAGTRKQIHKEFRSLYGGEVDERGRPDQTVEGYELRAPLILAGEDRPRDAAIQERILPFQPKKELIEGDTKYKEAFNTLDEKGNALGFEGFALSYFTWALQQEGWEDLLQESLNAVQAWCDENNRIVPNRIEKNLAIMWFGKRMLDRFAEDQGIARARFQGGMILSAMEHVVDELMPNGARLDAFDRLMRFLTRLARTGELEEDVHYVIKPSDNLVLRLGEALLEARQMAKRMDWRGEIRQEESYRSLVRDKAGEDASYVMRSSERGTFQENGEEGTARRRGILIDPDALQDSLNVDAEAWTEDAGSDEHEPQAPY